MMNCTTMLRFVLFSMCAALGACASPDPGRRLTTNWIIQPTEAPREPINVASGGFVMRQTVYPEAVAQIGNTVQHGSGEDDRVEKDSYLYAVNNPTTKVFCAMNLANSSTLQKILSGPSTVQRCLVDADFDGKFESKFVARSPIEGIPLVNGLLPEKRDPVEPPAPYSEVGPSIVGDAFWVGIRYDGKPLLYNRRNFSIDFGNDDADSGLTDWQYVKGENYPQSLSMLGSLFSVIDEDTDSLTIRVERTMPRQPFSVVQTTSYQFY